MKVSKFNKFPLILTAIGLAADIITIIVFYDNLTNSSSKAEISDLSIILLFFVMTYSWFTISWILVGQSFSKQESNGNKSIISMTTFGIGFFLAPIPIAVNYLRPESEFIWFHLLMWIIVYLSIRLLIPVIKPEFKKYLKQDLLLSEMFTGDASKHKGKWECTLNYTSEESKEVFSISDFIVVYEQVFSDGTYSDYFFYNSSNNGKGIIHYSELDTYWKKVAEGKS